MKTFIKVVALLLTLCMFIPCLAACGDETVTTAGQNDTTAAPGGDTSTPDGTSTPDDDDPLVPKVDVVDMGRYNYNAYVRGTSAGNGSFYCEDFWVDPSTGGADALSYSVIARNNQIEDDYNCKIVQTWSTEYNMYTEMTTFFAADRKFELAILVATDAAVCAVNGYLSDLKADVNTAYMDLENPAFDQNSIEQMTLGENLYFLSGDMNISPMDCTVSTVFNVEYFNSVSSGIVDALGDEMYGDIYQMVEDGNWTLANMLKIADTVAVDADESDGTLSFDKGDTIGYFQYFASPLYYFYAAGMRITTNEGGYPVFTVTTDEAQETYELLFDSLNTNLNPMLPDGYSAERATNFLNGAVLFTDYILWDIRRVLYPAEADVYYGILPNPVINEGDDYHSLVYFESTVHLWAIPYKRQNVEYSARMLEVMAAYSASGLDSTMDAYYIKTMYMNVARDDGSRASLDIIRGCLVYDIALMYSNDNAGNLWGDFDNLLLGIVNDANYQYETYTSEARMNTANEQLQDTIDKFMEMSENS